MACLIYEINKLNYSLFGAIPWLRENMGSEHTTFKELFRYKAEHASDWQYVYGELQKVASQLPLCNIDDISYFAGNGWRFFYAVTSFRLANQKIQSFVVLDIDDDDMAVMFRLRFSE